MIIERLGADTPFNPEGDPAQRVALIRHLEKALGRQPSTFSEPEHGTKPMPLPEHGTKPMPLPKPDKKPMPPDPAEMTRHMAVQWWNHNFMQAMIFGDEEIIGPKPDED